MSGTWSHLTCPPQPPFPVRISDDVFLPVPSPTSLRASSSEPLLNFELKGLKVLANAEGEKEVVKVSEIKMKRRNTLLMTPGEVHRLGTLSVSIFPQLQPKSKQSVRKTIAPKTPQPIHRKVASDISTPSTSSDFNDEDEEGSEYDTCSSTFSTPFSSLRGISAKYKNNDQFESPCPSQPSSKILNPSSILIHDDERGTFGQRIKSSATQIDGLPSSKDTKFNFWRSPKHNASIVGSSPFEESQPKRRRISQIEWEGMPCPEELVSPKTKQRVNELGKGFSWASLH
ncbi:hypothetical protein L486_03110 [Kwoniella mangroviensis CBS 10435]|uniref:Uncharacterized protein n=1 Tax=Kwoniella mangroviensis CBS 10435 TaxID=1331196 RepID=A0A1B9ISV3_9TREE|nr:hypothetical protein L486_03110 [Kwoniella mangroviensis CBS 10435]